MKMTPKEAQRQIAELQGWFDLKVMSDGIITGQKEKTGSYVDYYKVPDWFNDANAAMTLAAAINTDGTSVAKFDYFHDTLVNNFTDWFYEYPAHMIAKTYLEAMIGESIELIEEGEADAD